MTFRQAAIFVLQRSDRPLTVREITDRAVAGGLLQTSGKTPEATMSAILYAELFKGDDAEIQRICDQGPGRARRGSVRWVAV